MGLELSVCRIFVARHKQASRRVVWRHAATVRHIHDSHRGIGIQGELGRGGLYGHLCKIAEHRKTGAAFATAEGVCHVIGNHIIITFLDIDHRLDFRTVVILHLKRNAIGQGKTGPVGILVAGRIGGTAHHYALVLPGKVGVAVCEDINSQVLTVRKGKLDIEGV